MAAGKKMPDEKHTDPPVTGRSLRDAAEKQLARVPKRSVDTEGQSSEELFHELRVHQIELEMQAEDLRRAQLALEESRDKYLDLYEFAPLGYLTLTDKALITGVNLTGAALLGVERNTLVNARFSKYIAQQDSDDWHRYFLQLLNKEEKQVSALMLTRGDGSVFPARLEGIRIPGRSGEIMVRLAISDITEIRQVEEELRGSEERYRTIVENCNDAIYIHDFKGTILDLNMNACLMLGYTRGELAGASLEKINGEENRSVQKGRMDRLLTESSILYDGVHVKKDGTVIPVEISARVVSWEGDGIIHGFVRDISGRKTAEEALRVSNKKLNLLSSITRHDISSQTTALQGFVALLEKKVPDPSFADYFRMINAAADRISAMIQFTKTYENIGVHAPDWHDCRTLVTTAAEQAHAGQLRVKNDLPAGTEVFADPLIAKVFYNLIDNAGRHGGKITTVRFSVRERDGKLIIVCEDDGRGVPAGRKERIFERGSDRNTGMGLFLSREILSITGITLRETGKPGEGARFGMTVPKGAYRFIGMN